MSAKTFICNLSHISISFKHDLWHVGIPFNASVAGVEFQKRLQEETLAGCPELLQRTVQKMLIIMPESCFCPPQFSEDGKIEHTDKFVVRVAHRAGNKHRDYKSSLYKIIDHQVN